MSVDKDKFWLVLLPDSGDPLLKSFETQEGLAAHLRVLPPTMRGYLFHGRRLGVTGGPFRYLVNGEASVPLFDSPRVGKVDKSDRLGFAAGDGELDPDYEKLMKGLAPSEPKPASFDDDDDDSPAG